MKDYPIQRINKVTRGKLAQQRPDRFLSYRGESLTAECVFFQNKQNYLFHKAVWVTDRKCWGTADTTTLSRLKRKTGQCTLSTRITRGLVFVKWIFFSRNFSGQYVWLKPFDKKQCGRLCSVLFEFGSLRTKNANTTSSFQLKAETRNIRLKWCDEKTESEGVKESERAKTHRCRWCGSQVVNQCYLYSHFSGKLCTNFGIFIIIGRAY